MNFTFTLPADGPPRNWNQLRPDTLIKCVRVFSLINSFIECLVPGRQRAGTAWQYNSHEGEKLKISTQINVKKFHVVGPETLNAVSPSFVLVRSMIKSVAAAERRRLLDSSNVRVWRTQSVQSLMMDDLKLKSDLNVLLSALGSNTSLTELDIRSDRIDST